MVGSHFGKSLPPADRRTCDHRLLTGPLRICRILPHARDVALATSMSPRLPCRADPHGITRRFRWREAGARSVTPVGTNPVPSLAALPIFFRWRDAGWREPIQPRHPNLRPRSPQVIWRVSVLTTLTQVRHRRRDAPRAVMRRPRERQRQRCPFVEIEVSAVVVVSTPTFATLALPRLVGGRVVTARFIATHATYVVHLSRRYSDRIHPSFKRLASAPSFLSRIHPLFHRTSDLPSQMAQTSRIHLPFRHPCDLKVIS